MILTLMLLCSPLVALATDTAYSRELSPDEFSSFSQGDGLRVLYFYRYDDLAASKRAATYDAKVAVGGERGAGWEASEAAVSERLTNFFKAYEGAAEVLDSYDVQMGKVGCKDEYPASVEKYCGLINVGYYVQCYRGGELVLEWPLENMLAVDAIISNVLDLVLRDEIPTIETKQCRRNEELEARGKKNFLVGYFKKIGTSEHRNFMEIGHEFHKTVDFAATASQRAVNDLPWFDYFDEAAIWVFFCKEAQGNHPCQVVKHMGGMCQNSMRQLISVLDLPAIHDVSEQGDMNPYDGKDIHQAVAFYDGQSEEYVKGEASEAAARLRGFLGILLVNVDETDAAAYGYDLNQKTPSMALKIRGSHELNYKPADQLSFEFVAGQLGKLHRGLEEFMRDDFVDGYTRVFEDYHDRSFEKDVEKEDSPLAAEEWRLRWQEPLDTLDRKNLPALTDHTFPDRKINSDLVIVLFHIYLDQRNTAVFRSFLEAADILAEEGLHPFATVECFDYTDVCRKEDMFLYPSIRIYRKNRDWVTYDGIFSTEAFLSRAKLYLASAPHMLTSEGEALRFMDGQLPPDMASFTDTSVLGLFDSDQQQEIASFKKAAEQEQGKLQYGLATGDVAKQLASKYNTQTPSVVIRKRNDPYQPIITTDKICPAHISEAAQPIFPELTGSNFVRYLKTGKPMAILFSDRADSAQHDAMADLVKEDRFPGLILAWMNAENVGSPGARVLLDYDATAALPTLVLTDRQKGTVHLKDEIASSVIAEWIQDVLDEKEPRKKGLNAHVWKARNPSYNFLKFVDDVEAQTAEEPPAQDDQAARQEQLRQDLLQQGLDPERPPATKRTEL